MDTYVVGLGGLPAPTGPERQRSAAGEQGRLHEVVENPLSGERITILRRDGGPEENALVWDLVLGPGGRVPSSHAHPHQQECFMVLDGELDLRVDFYPRHALVSLGPWSAYLDGAARPWQQRRWRQLAAWQSESPGRQMMITEGQAEPWEAVTVPPTPTTLECTAVSPRM